MQFSFFMCALCKCATIKDNNNHYQLKVANKMNYESHMLLWENTHAQVRQIQYVEKVNTDVEMILGHSAILIVIEGDMNLWLDEIPYHINRLAIFHIGKSAFMHLTMNKPSTYYLLYYKADVVYTDAFIQHLHMEHRPFHKNFSCVPTNPIAIDLLMQNMYIKWKTGSFEEHLTVKILFYELIYRIFHELTEEQGKPHPIDLAAQALMYMEQHMDEALTMQKLADSLTISSRHLLRVFKARYGMGPQQYLLQRRMEVAKQHLQKNERTIKAIANHLGYEDEYYFSRAFKKQVGVAPSIYRTTINTMPQVDSVLSEPLIEECKERVLQMKAQEKIRKQRVLQDIQSSFLQQLLHRTTAAMDKRS